MRKAPLPAFPPGGEGKARAALTGRRRDRYLALFILYTREVTGERLEDIVRKYRERSKRGGPPPYTLELLELVQEHADEIDRVIEAYADRWSIQRMPLVDRSLLRMAAAEILYREDVPPGVSINECVEMAKRFSTGDSGKFINGVLGHLLRDLERGEGPAAAARGGG